MTTNGRLRGEMFWVDRWTTSRAFLLPMEARGVYREMLSQAWCRGAELPNDPKAIQRIIGATPDEWRRAWPLVKPFWRVRGKALVNDTQVAIYTVAQQRHQSAVIRGAKGATIRWPSR
jgi:uncharacterized protein YdaU (DUF1376 family)